jgi:hypothetical protein
MSPAAPTAHFPWLRAFAVLAAAYAVVFWPALREPWWSRDDYSLAAMSADQHYAMAMQTGRPAYILLFRTLPLDSRPDAAVWNVALRAGRALLHVAAALLIAFALWRPLGSAAAAVAATLPFLLWFFNPDAVLMRLAAGYPLGALLAVGALLLVRVREGPAWRRGACWLLGWACGVAAALCNQVPAAAGLALAPLLLALETHAGRGPGVRAALREAALLGLAFVAGGLVSRACILHGPLPPAAGRAGLAFDPVEKAALLCELHRLFFSGGYGVVSRGLVAAQAGLVVLAVAVAGAAGLRGRRPAAWLPLAGLACLALLPQLTTLLVPCGLLSPRLMYLTPLLLCGCVAVVFAVSRARPAVAAGAVLLAALLAYDARYGRVNAADYVRAEAADRDQLRRLERLADAHGCRGVVLLVEDERSVDEARRVPVRDWNPYRLRFLLGDNHTCAFTKWWAAEGFLERYSRLPIVRDPGLVERARAAVRPRWYRPRPPGVGLRVLADAGVVVVTPP